jgi:threonyl-tRNA synthetase
MTSAFFFDKAYRKIRIIWEIMTASINHLSQESINITLPDGTVRSFNKPTNGHEVAMSIGAGLAKAALAVIVDDTMIDLNDAITADCTVSIVTRKSDEALELIRHDTAHILAMAVQELFPNTQITIGPVIEDGFYYDFHREKPFTISDFEAIESKMRDIIKRDDITRKEIWSRNDAIKHFKDIGEHFKAELVESIPEDQKISIYYHGDSWHDLCRGPHMVSTAKVGTAFKLMKVAGAYWRGDHRNPQLQRIYGTAWRDEKELEAYLFRLEEAERRDHRRLGKELGLFHQQEEAAGMVFWHTNGNHLWRVLEDYMRRRLNIADYQEIKTPQLVDRKLWEASGHWEKFSEHMYVAHSEDRTFALKPMSCPCHVQVFNNSLKSYRNLPLRIAEFGSCHRYEPSGALHGIMRVRSFTQDDGHIFCTEDQITSETVAFCGLLASVYKDLGFESFKVKFSDRPEKRSGADDVWDKAENALIQAVSEAGYDYEINKGEGAFYGPKLEFVLRDAIGRDWQCGTLQVDFVLPERLGAEYVGEDGAKHRPVMLHRAILGSFERFIGILIEQYAGRFPVWLSPVQVAVMNITSEAETACDTLYHRLRKNNIRVIKDFRNEKISYKVREHMTQGVPILAIIGKNEIANDTVSVRRRGDDGQTVMTISEFIKKINQEATPPDILSETND